MMNFNITYILLLIIVLLILSNIFLFFIIIKQRRLFKRKLSKSLNLYNSRIRELEKEIKRLNYIIVDYKGRLKLTGKDVEINTKDLDVNELILEKQQLQREREHLQQKTKRLWEQSLAIHKVKERIDGLRKEIERRHREMVDSVNYALRIQRALLPKEDIFSKLVKEYFILWMPKQIVSGDFYWLKKIVTRLIVVAADCTGHGVPGAFMSLLGISFLEQITSSKPELHADEILEELRDKVITALQQDESSETKDGMDLALVIIDTQTMDAEYAGANNPLFIYRDNEIMELKPVRNPIGIYLRQKSFNRIDLKVRHEDIFYMFSDGYIDQFNGKTKNKLTKKRFRNILIKLNEDQIPLKEQGDFLKQIIIDWKSDTYQLDDILVIGFRI